MRQKLLFLPLLAVLLLAGCGGPVGRKQADQLSTWLGKQSYSSWSTFRNQSGDPRPASPDGLTLGSPNVFAAIGCNPDDLTEITVLWGDQRKARALAKPVTVSASIGLGEKPLAKFAHQTLQRIRHTSISVAEAEEEGLRIRAVDFAPMGSADNFLVRWFLVENGGNSTRRVALSVRIAGGGEWKKRSRHAYQLGEKLAVVSDQDLEASDDTLTLRMGRIGSGARASAALFFVVARGEKELGAGIGRAEAARGDPLRLLDHTKTEWTEWCTKTPLATGDERTDDLLDSLLCLVRSHVGTDAIHTGSTHYAHDRAWVRDDYWVQRTLFELGLTQEGKTGLDFFHRAWQKGGIASSYQTEDGKAMSWGYSRVELPHYLVLMVKDAEQYGHVDPKAYWDMVKGCLDRAAFPESGLQPMNGDETWILAAPVRELDDMLDNSWLLIASAEYGSKLAHRLGDRERAARYGAMAYQARLALRKFMPENGEAEWLATGRGSDGSLDLSLCPEVYARGAVLDVLPATDSHIAAGLVASWERLKFEGGVRTHSRSATVNGGTPGYVLYAMSNNPGCDSLFRRDLVSRVQHFASATGNVWEFHDIHDPAWGGEKRRLWDSAVLLLGLTHALFEVQHADRTYLVRKPEPVELALPPDESPGFDAQELLTSSSGLVILQDHSPEHAARLARELLRQTNRMVEIDTFSGTPPDDRPAIIVSPADPPVPWLLTGGGYYLHAWGGPPQLWVRNNGNVFADTDGVLLDLLSYLTPQREAPLPFPDANYDLAARYGEPPGGHADVEGYWSGPSVRKSLDLDGGETELALGQAKVKFSSGPSRDKRGVIALTLSATRLEPVEVSVTLPAGWWVLYARDMTGGWDRVGDPVHEEHLADGRVQLTYSLRAEKEPLNLSFDLAKLRVKER